MTENVEQIQTCRDALAPEDVLIGDANGGSNNILLFNTIHVFGLSPSGFCY